jgi:hypothetical protein
VIQPALRRGLAEKAVARHGVSIALACPIFGMSETCYRYSPLLSDKNEEIANLLVGLTTARKTWGFGAMFPASAQCAGPSVEPQADLPHLLRTGTELADQTSETVKAGQTRCAGSAGRTERDLVDGLHGGSPRGTGDDAALCRQVFIEPKGKHLENDEAWKSNFLVSIAHDANDAGTLAPEPHQIRGLPFFNAEPSRRQNFQDAFIAMLQE